MALDPAEIHYGIRGQRFGPVDLHTLVERIRSGQLSAEDFLWDEDLQDWVPLRRYGVLLASLGEELPDEIDPEDPRLQPLPGDAPGIAAPPEGVVPAGILLRAVAWLVDGLVLLVPLSMWFMWVLDFTAFDLEAWSQTTQPTPEMESAALRFYGIVQLGVFLIHGIYHALLESSAWQATLGKRAMGIRVTDEEGRRISLGRAVGRHFGRILCELTFMLGYLMIVMTEKGQGLHDRLAGTLVIRNR